MLVWPLKLLSISSVMYVVCVHVRVSVCVCVCVCVYVCACVVCVHVYSNPKLYVFLCFEIRFAIGVA